MCNKGINLIIIHSNETRIWIQNQTTYCKKKIKNLCLVKRRPAAPHGAIEINLNLKLERRRVVQFRVPCSVELTEDSQFSVGSNGRRDEGVPWARAVWNFCLLLYSSLKTWIFNQKTKGTINKLCSIITTVV